MERSHQVPPGGLLEIKAVVFDLDGVILDSMPAHVAAWQAVFTEIGQRLGADFFYRHEGNLDRDLLERTIDLPGLDLGPDVFDRLLVRQREIYIDRYAEQVHVYSAIDRILEHLRASDRGLALVTSSPRDVLTENLWTWLRKYFPVVVTGDRVKRGKPHPDPYLAALAGLELPPSRALAVENAPAGIQAARAAGLWCLGLTTTMPPEALSEADVIIPDHDALESYLSGSWFDTRLDSR